MMIRLLALIAALSAAAPAVAETPGGYAVVVSGKTLNDPEWQKVAAASEANGKILAKSPESVFMDPADFSKLK